MRARNKAEDNIIESEALFHKLFTRHPDLRHICMFTSIKSLGGEVHYNNILLDTRNQNVFWNEGLELAGLEIGAYTEISNQVDANTLEELIELLSTTQLSDHQNKLRGLFVTVYSNLNKLGHAFVIFPYSILSQKRSKKLIQQKKYLIVDIADGKPIGKTSQII
jgi:hypothetical protein